MKNSNDTIENRTRDLPACSAVPQPTVQPRAPTHSPLYALILLLTLFKGTFYIAKARIDFHTKYVKFLGTHNSYYIT